MFYCKKEDVSAVLSDNSYIICTPTMCQAYANRVPCIGLVSLVWEPITEVFPLYHPHFTDYAAKA